MMPEYALEATVRRPEQRTLPDPQRNGDETEKAAARKRDKGKAIYTAELGEEEMRTTRTQIFLKEEMHAKRKKRGGTHLKRHFCSNAS
jgi:hypothetical protein